MSDQGTGTISLEGVTKVFPNGVIAVNELSLEVEPGEFLVLVGPSGVVRPLRCGWLPGSSRSPGARSGSTRRS